MKIKSTKTLRLTIFVFLAVSNFLTAEVIQIRADSMSGKSGNKSDETNLSGNAYVKTDSMEISADSISLSGEDFRFITAEGSVDGKNTESKLDFNCGKLVFDRMTKIARLEDSVHLDDLENEVSADAQLIEYNQQTETATLQIGVTLKQKENVCTSAYALYRKNEQMLEMSGNPRIVQGEDSFRAQEITLNLKTQEITLDGRVSGTVTDSGKKEEQPAPQEEEVVKDD